MVQNKHNTEAAIYENRRGVGGWAVDKSYGSLCDVSLAELLCEYENNWMINNVDV